jgi:hypothetical protein
MALNFTPHGTTLIKWPANYFCRTLLNVRRMLLIWTGKWSLVKDHFEDNGLPCISAYTAALSK